MQRLPLASLPTTPFIGTGSFRNWKASSPVWNPKNGEALNLSAPDMFHWPKLWTGHSLGTDMRVPSDEESWLGVSGTKGESLRPDKPHHPQSDL